MAFNPSRRVVITGVGVVSPLGLSARETWSNALEGKVGVPRPVAMLLRMLVSAQRRAY